MSRPAASTGDIRPSLLETGLDWADPALSPAALRAGKLCFAGEDGVLPYLESRRLWLGFGEPLAPPSRRPRLLRAFFAAARSSGRSAAVMPVGPFLAATLGRSLFLGESGTLDLRGFCLRGNRRKTVRQSVSRMERQGYRFHLLGPPHGADVVSDLRTVSDAWLVTKRVPENRAVLGWFEDSETAASRVAVVLAPGGSAEAFATLYPVEGGAGLDLLRRRPGCPSGTMDLLVAGVAHGLRAEGYRRLELGLAPGTSGGRPVPRMVRAVAWVAGRRSWYGCEGLRRFKNKFRPVWTPRYAVYRTPADLVEAFRMTTGIGLSRGGSGAGSKDRHRAA